MDLEEAIDAAINDAPEAPIANAAAIDDAEAPVFRRFAAGELPLERFAQLTRLRERACEEANQAAVNLRMALRSQAAAVQALNKINVILAVRAGDPKYRQRVRKEVLRTEEVMRQLLDADAATSEAAKAFEKASRRFSDATISIFEEDWHEDEALYSTSQEGSSDDAISISSSSAISISDGEFGHSHASPPPMSSPSRTTMDLDGTSSGSEHGLASADVDTDSEAESVSAARAARVKVECDADDEADELSDDEENAGLDEPLAKLEEE
jgi:hypothetical protein